jgi:hypothetical protein
MLSSLVACSVASSPASLDVWPRPSSATGGATKLSIAANKQFFHLEADSPLLTAAFERYWPLVFPHGETTAKASNAVGRLTLTVADVDESHPTIDTDESYEVRSNVDGRGPNRHVLTPAFDPGRRSSRSRRRRRRSRPSRSMARCVASRRSRSSWSSTSPPRRTLSGTGTSRTRRALRTVGS